MELRQLEHEYVFDHRIVEEKLGEGCGGCALLHRREKTICLSERPKEWNGLMIVGEGPGSTEAAMKRPFVGSSGALLDKLLKVAGIPRENVYITNATLCQPGSKSGESWQLKMKDAQVVSAVQHCRSRLLAEIEFYQPRVILALGQAALDALTGSEKRIEKRKPFSCAACNNARTWKVWRCAKCKQATFTAINENGDDIQTCHYVVTTPGVKPTPPADGTPCCNAKWQPYKVSCPTCEGKKTKLEVEVKWAAPYKIGEIAGGCFRASTLPIAERLREPDKTLVISTYHPSFLLRKVDSKAQKQIGGQFLAWAALVHIKKALRLLDSDPVFPFRWRQTQDVAELEAYWARTDVPYSCDIETDSKESQEVTDIRCFGVNREDTDESIVIDTSLLPTSHPVIQAICAFLRDPTKRKMGQNFIYDMAVIERVWECKVEGLTEDTLIGHNVIAPDEPHDLAHIAFLYTDAPPWKPPKASKKGGFVFDSKEELYEYNARDVRTTSLSMQAIRLELDREGARQVHDLDIRKFALARQMQEVGMPINRKRMLEIGMEAQFEMEQATHEMRKLVGRIPDSLVAKDEGANADAFALVPSKPRHLIWALFDPYGPFKLAPMKFNVDTRTPEWPMGTPQTGKKALLDYVEHPFVIQLLRFKQNQSVKSNLVDGNVLGPDMRIHPQWNPLGARTGRWSSSPNWQNVKRRYRVMVEAPPGRIIIGADASQLELRLTAALSGDAEMIRRCMEAVEDRKLEPDYDPHSFVAAITFGAGYTDLLLSDPRHEKTNPRCACQTCTRRNLRDIIKRVIYGRNYGGGAPTLRESIYNGGYEGVPITIEMIEQVLVAIDRAFPQVNVWREGVIADANRTGYVRDALINRFRTFPLMDVEYTVAANFPIQSSAASVVDLGTLDLADRLHSADPSAFIFAQVHDALYVEADENRSDAVEALMSECLSSEVRFHDDAAWMPLPAKAHGGANWLEAA